MKPQGVKSCTGGSGRKQTERQPRLPSQPPMSRGVNKRPREPSHFIRRNDPTTNIAKRPVDIPIDRRETYAPTGPRNDGTDKTDVSADATIESSPVPEVEMRDAYPPSEHPMISIIEALARSLSQKRAKHPALDADHDVIMADAPH
ncbi:hypothetical protein EYZ11_000540 [Aspergillus tanneri]|uniref:Uncharacterized protein n=1 Tax=Aspergillus tanneri TaxID=1220188 RepID=A0A4S3JWT4_9EURO|nr:uncharacterized protein ATNIH1004_004062 [Aspergillus tanneri]KAA8648179.1 hypothetical protein ATNIH1004_004062 [Aspergillus tanneri]THC99961.1 hypothetical protein EYZ11_000540 [Aspergillus tanneri]